MKRLRILAIIPAPRCFGLQNITLQFFARLSRSASCHFLLSKWSDGEFSQRLSDLNIPHTETWLGMFSRKLDWMNLRMTLICLSRLPSAYLAFLKLIFRFQPDVVYLANHHEAILLWPVFLPFRKRIVCHMHDPPPAVCFQKASFSIWRQAIGRFVCVSNDVKDRLTKLGALGPSDVVIHNGVQIGPLEPSRTRNDRFCRQFDWPPGTIIVGMTGQTSSHKGHEDFIAAAAFLKVRYPTARFVISVKASEPFFDVLRDRRRWHDLERHLGFVEWLPTVKDFFEGIDIFVLPSRHEEGFGLVVAEAGERGLPAVCTKSGGAVEVLSDGVTGTLIERQNPRQMADAIAHFMEAPELRKVVGLAARRRIEREFDLDRQSERLLDALGAAGRE